MQMSRLSFMARSLRPSAFSFSSSLLIPLSARCSPTARAVCHLSAAQMIQPAPATGPGSVVSGTIRVRQHLNPLARRWCQPVQLPEQWYSIAFKDSALPLVVDLGVAKGRFLLNLAKIDKSRNFLGIEIREALVHQANRCAQVAGLTNLFYVACNANVSFLKVMNDAPAGVTTQVYIQFCDPWFKKRHAKRRMVNSLLVEDIYSALSYSRQANERKQQSELNQFQVFMQTDVMTVANEMKHVFERHGGFIQVGDDEGLKTDKHGWLVESPLAVPTEREICVASRGESIYRVLYNVKSKNDGIHSDIRS